MKDIKYPYRYTVHEFFRGLRKLRAIDRIKAQPFFSPRSNFYMGAKWSPETIRAFHAMECAKFEINRVCGLDMGSPDGDITVKAVATFGSAHSKEWLQPDSAGGLVAMSQRFAYDESGRLTEVGEPEQTGGRIKP